MNVAKIGETSMNGFWRWNSSVPEATLNVSDAVKKSKNVTLEFNLKASNPNDQPNNAFGIVMAADYKGVNMSFWNTTNEVDGVLCRALKGCMLGNDEYGDDKNNTNDWIEVAMYGTDGVNIRVIREGANIKFYAQDATAAEGEQWKQVFATTCDESADTDIKFLAMGSDFTISAISVALPDPAPAE